MDAYWMQFQRKIPILINSALKSQNPIVKNLFFSDEIPSPATDCTDAPEIPDEVLEDIDPQQIDPVVVDIREEKRVEMKSESESDSESESMSQTVEGTSGEPEVMIQPIKEENEEVSKTEDVTAASNDSTDKLETDDLVTKASESIAQVELKEPETVSEEDEVKPDVKPEVVMPEVSASVPVKEVETVEEVVEKKESPKEPEAPVEIDNEAPVAIPTTDGLETTTGNDHFLLFHTGSDLFSRSVRTIFRSVDPLNYPHLALTLPSYSSYPYCILTLT